MPVRWSALGIYSDLGMMSSFYFLQFVRWAHVQMALSYHIWTTKKSTSDHVCLNRSPKNIYWNLKLVLWIVGNSWFSPINQITRWYGWKQSLKYGVPLLEMWWSKSYQMKWMGGKSKRPFRSLRPSFPLRDPLYYQGLIWGNSPVHLPPKKR